MTIFVIILAAYSMATTSWIIFRYLQGPLALVISMDTKVVAHLVTRGTSTPTEIANVLTSFNLPDQEVDQAIARLIARGLATRTEHDGIELTESSEVFVLGN